MGAPAQQQSRIGLMAERGDHSQAFNEPQLRRERQQQEIGGATYPGQLSTQIHVFTLGLQP